MCTYYSGRGNNERFIIVSVGLWCQVFVVLMTTLLFVVSIASLHELCKSSGFILAEAINADQ